MEPIRYPQPEAAPDEVPEQSAAAVTGRLLPVTNTSDTSWGFRAECKDRNPDIFHSDEGGSLNPARLICGRCAVQEECLDFIMETEEPSARNGVWGGLSRTERTLIQNEVRDSGQLAARALIAKLRQKGYTAAHAWHLRRTKKYKSAGERPASI
jgi:WhiB family redox-sensing transcriptional regulator